jgi:succinate dehydrogenase / fumarate reductase flavoprotein subunit
MRWRVRNRAADTSTNAFETEEHEALRDDDNFCHAAAWEHTGDGQEPELHKEPLVFENVKLTQRSYK